MSRLDYLQHWWWAPAIILWVVGWLVGGAWLLRRSIGRRRPNGRPAIAKCMLASFCGGLSGLVAGGVFFKLFEALGSAADADWTILALIVGALAAISGFTIIVYAIFALSARQTLLSIAPVVGGLALLTAVIVAAAGVPAYYATRAERRREAARQKLIVLYHVLVAEQTAALRAGTPRQQAVPQDLSNVIQQVDPIILRSPGRPGEEVGVFYLPPSEPLATGAREWIAAELGSHDGGRAALRADGYAAWFSQKDFAGLMSEPENARFAEALREAGGL